MKFTCRRFFRVTILSVGLCFLTHSATAFQVEQPATSVLLITVDTLRADYVGCYASRHLKTPCLDGLAEDGVLFETAYSQVPLTPPSHASILTGRYPASHGLRDFTIGQFRAGIPSFATILRERGYKTAAFVSAFVLDESWGLSEGFDLYYDEFDLEELQGTNPGNVQRKAEETIDQVLLWFKKAGRPFFLWVHLFDPHHDYVPPPPFDRRYRSNPYAGEVAYADQELGRLIQAFKAADLYEDTLIIATSDHGESLGEHGENQHGFFLYEATTRIPLIIKLPSSYNWKGRKVATIAQTIDILPTALQVLRIRPEEEWGIEGRGLLSHILEKRGSEAIAYAETYYPQTSFGWSALRQVRQGAYKYIEAPSPELYNVVEDPEERVNLYTTSGPLAHQLRVQLLRLEQGFTSQKSAAPATVDPESIERLGALGYVSVTQPLRIEGGARLPDPKEKVHVFDAILKGLQASEAGEFRRSNQMLEEVARENPELFIVHYSIGLNHLKMGRSEQALQLFERASALNPDFNSIQINRARCLDQLGRQEEAVQVLEELTEKHPTNLSAQRLLAGFYRQRRNLSAAIQIYRYILTRRKDDRLATKFLGIALVEERNFTEGLEALSHSVEMGLDDAQLRNSQGIALANTGRSEDAILAYRKALEMNPDYPQPRLNLAFSLLRAGRKAEAVQEFDKLCQTSPELCERYRSRFE